MLDSNMGYQKLVDAINAQQRERGIKRTFTNYTQDVLFNKGRYFELSIYGSQNKDLLRSMAQATGVKVQYNNMLVGGRNKLERLVKAFNKRGIYVNINLDWI